MLKAGNYLCKVAAPFNGWFGEAGEHKTPFLRIPLIVTEEGDAEGDEITFQGWLTDKSLDRTCKNLAEVFGWDGDLEALAKQVKDGPFVGKFCRIVTAEEEYNGKKRIVIKWLNHVDGGGAMMPPDAAKSLAAKLAARAKAAVTGAEAPPSSRAHPKPPAPDPLDADLAPDDIPFLIPFAFFLASQFG